MNVSNVPGAQGAAPPPAPANHLVPAILTTILCFLPAGVVSIVYAAQVDSKYREGDYAGAQDASEKARKWWIGALIAGLVAGALYLIFVLVTFASIPSPVEPPSIQAPSVVP